MPTPDVSTIRLLLPIAHCTAAVNDLGLKRKPCRNMISRICLECIQPVANTTTAVSKLNVSECLVVSMLANFSPIHSIEHLRQVTTHNPHRNIRRQQFANHDICTDLLVFYPVTCAKTVFFFTPRVFTTSSPSYHYAIIVVLARDHFLT